MLHVENNRQMTAAEAGYSLTFILATTIPLQTAFAHLANLITDQSKTIEGSYNGLSAAFSCIFISYIFIRIYIVIHNIDDYFLLDDLTKSANRISMAIERTIRLLLFILVLMFFKPIKMGAVDSFISSFCFRLQQHAYTFVNSPLCTFYEKKSSNQGSTSNICPEIVYRFEYYWPDQDLISILAPRTGVLIFAIAVLFIAWDLVALVLRNYASIKITQTNEPPTEEVIALSLNNHAYYICEKYLDRIHGIKFLFLKLLHIAVHKTIELSNTNNIMRSWIMLIASVVLQVISYFFSFKFFERLFLMLFGMLLTATYRMEANLTFILLILFGLLSTALSSYQNKIGSALVVSIIKPLIFIFGIRIGKSLALAAIFWAIWSVHSEFLLIQQMTTVITSMVLFVTLLFFLAYAQDLLTKATWLKAKASICQWWRAYCKRPCCQEPENINPSHSSLSHGIRKIV